MSATEIILFESSDGVVTLPVEVDTTREEVWLSRQQMSLLFGRDVKTIGKHVNNALRKGCPIPAMQLSQNLRQLHRTERHIRLNTTA